MIGGDVMSLQLYETRQRCLQIGHPQQHYITGRRRFSLRTPQQLIGHIRRLRGDLTVYAGEAPDVIPYRHPVITRELTTEEQHQLRSDLAELVALARNLTRAELLEHLRSYAPAPSGAAKFTDRVVTTAAWDDLSDEHLLSMAAAS
jgi:hypothetical protein